MAGHTLNPISVRSVWADFEDRVLLDDTLVAFWTDHGESFGEHDDQFYHGVSLYDSENRSTAAFWAQDIARIGPRTRWSMHYRLFTMFPTARGLPA